MDALACVDRCESNHSQPYLLITLCFHLSILFRDVGLVCSSLLASAVPLSLFQPPSTAQSPLQVGPCSGLEGGNSSPQRTLCQPWASKVKTWLAGADELLHTHPCSSSLAVFLQGKHQGSASSSLLANAESRMLPDITPHKQQLFPPSFLLCISWTHFGKRTFLWCLDQECS